MKHYFLYFRCTLILLFNQNPNEDTEWNDVLRAKGIIPQKPIEKEMTEDEIVQMLEGTIQEKTGGSKFILTC